MSEPRYTQFTERMYANLPEVVRESDSLHGYALKHYISAIGDVEDQVERLVARFDYLTKQDRLDLDSLSDDYNYYGLDYSYFQVADSKRSALVTSNNDDPVYLRSAQAYRIVPNTTIYVGAVFRTDQASALNTYGIRLWYYDASMELVATKDVGRNNGSVGPQWNVINSADNTPNDAYHVRVSPFGQNTSGAPAKLWVDDVYVRSHYEVTTTNNLVSGGHNYLLRSEQQMVKQGDFDSQREALYMVDYLRAQAVEWPNVAPNLKPWGDFEDPRIGSGQERGSAGWNRVYEPSSAPEGATSFIETVVGLSQGGLTGGDRSSHSATLPDMPVEQGHKYLLSYEVWTDAPTDNLAVGYFPTWRRADGTINNGNWGSIFQPIRRSEAPVPGAESSNGRWADPFVSGQWRTVMEIFTPESDAVSWVPRFHRWGAGSTAYGGDGTSVEGEVWRIGNIKIIDLARVDELNAQADELQENVLLSAWDRGPSTELVDRTLDGVPEAQSYRAWLDLKSINADQPGYARQLIQSVAPSATYDISLLMVRDANVPDDSTLRITITPNTGGPTIHEYSMADYDRNQPHLLAFTWNSPEAVSNAIINIEYVAPVPASGLLINDISMVRFTSDVTQIGRYGDVVSKHVAEKANTEMFGGSRIRGTGWIRYETQGDPDTEPLGPDDPDLPGGTSFIESAWHQTRPGNTYTFTGEVFSSHSSGYVDLMIWYRNEGKGWGELMFNRISASVVNSWVQFTRTITIPSNATEFRVNLDFYKGASSYTLDMRNVSLKATEDRSWYMAGSRPFAFNALATRSLNFLSRGDLVHYTAKVLVTGDTSGGRGGVRVYSNGSQVVHETLIRSVEKNTLLQITGSFQVSESFADLRVALYMNDPTPKHQAAYYLSDLEVVHSTQEYTKDAKNLIRNGGFEFANALEGWDILTERETVRKNLIPNAIGTVTTDMTSWASTDERALVTVEGLPAIRVLETGSGTGFYVYPQIKLSPPVGSTITMSVDVMMTHETTVPVRLVFGTYLDAMLANRIGPSIPQSPSDGFVRHTLSCVVTDMPEGGYVYAMVYPPAVDSNPFAVGQGLYIRNYVVEVNTDGPFFDRYTEDTTLANYKWDGEAHVETRREYQAPVNPSAYLTTAMGYNKEDVPARPEDLPLGSTSDLVDARTANTEWLPWLAQFAGRNISHFGSMDDARIALSSGNNFASGTIGAIQDAVATVLSGSKSVRIFPHTTNLTQIGKATQWDVSIVTRDSESPDVSVMEEAVRLRNAKPAGVTFHFHKHQSTWDAVELANPTWDIWDTRDWTGIEEAGLDG